MQANRMSNYNHFVKCYNKYQPLLDVRFARVLFLLIFHYFLGIFSFKELPCKATVWVRWKWTRFQLHSYSVNCYLLLGVPFIVLLFICLQLNHLFRCKLYVASYTSHNDIRGYKQWDNGLKPYNDDNVWYDIEFYTVHGCMKTTTLHIKTMGEDSVYHRVVKQERWRQNKIGTEKHTRKSDAANWRLWNGIESGGWCVCGTRRRKEWTHTNDWEWLVQFHILPFFPPNGRRQAERKKEEGKVVARKTLPPSQNHSCHNLAYVCHCRSPQFNLPSVHTCVWWFLVNWATRERKKRSKVISNSI